MSGVCEASIAARGLPLLWAATALLGCGATVPDLRSAGGDSVQIEEIEIDFPYWRLVFDGEVREAVVPEKLSSADIESLELILLPAVQRLPRPPDSSEPSAVTALAKLYGRIIGEQRRAYELVTITNGKIAKKVASLLGSIENLPEPPDEFVLVDARGEELLGIRRPLEILTFDMRRVEYRNGALRLAWTRPVRADDPRYEVFLSTDGFQTYKRVHPLFAGEGERRAMRRTSYTLDLTEHYVDQPEFFLLVLANDGLRVAWRAFRIALERVPEYEYRISIEQPSEGIRIYQHRFYFLSGSMDVRVETPGYRQNGRPYLYQPVDATLEWSSDRDGPPVRYRTHGHSFEVICPAHGLSPGDHRITLTGKTPTGVSASSTVEVVVVSEEGVAGRPESCTVPKDYRLD